jgi:hypothetical protein
VTELTLRYMRLTNCDRVGKAFGPKGTVWSVLSRQWLDKWKKYVGKRRVGNIDNDGDGRETDDRQDWPGIVDNSSLLLPLAPSAPKAQLHSLSLRPTLNHMKDFEAIPPVVVRAFILWYGGGPEILRQTVELHKPVHTVEDENNKVTIDSEHDISTSLEVDFFPLSLFIFSTDLQGRASAQSRELLISRSLTVSDLLLPLARELGTRLQSLRVWDTLNPNTESRPLQPTLPLLSFADGQALLLERERDGNWPLQSLTDKETDCDLEKDWSERELVTRNSGLVGLDNLGWLCFDSSVIHL